MSRGLGWLQKEILATLDEAKGAAAKKVGHYYRGDDTEAQHDGRPWRWSLPGWVYCHGAHVRLADDVYDLRCSRAHLAQMHRALDYGYVTNAFTAAVSRACAGLVFRGHLTPINMVPIVDYEEDHHLIHELSDGLYLHVPSQRQCRFVKR